MTSAVIINEARQGLIGAMINVVGLYDMLRFDQSPYAKERIAEYGDPHNATAFDWLYAYSPLHNIKENKAYPLVLLIKTDWGNAENWHTFKFLAELQFILPHNPNPFFLIDTDVGYTHDMYREQHAIAFAILVHALGFQRSN